MSKNKLKNSKEMDKFFKEISEKYNLEGFIELTGDNKINRKELEKERIIKIENREYIVAKFEGEKIINMYEAVLLHNHCDNEEYDNVVTLDHDTDLYMYKATLFIRKRNAVLSLDDDLLPEKIWGIIEVTEKEISAYMDYAPYEKSIEYSLYFKKTPWTKILKN